MDFQIAIVSQGWITGPDPDPADLCSHGQLEIIIGGTTITVADRERNDYTISTSALLLMRSAIDDHWLADAAIPYNDLILHCGMLSMMSCPIGINWNVAHARGMTCLSDVVRSDSVDRRQAVHFDGLTLELPTRQYRETVAEFARQAKLPYRDCAKTPWDEIDSKEYADFWAEYNALLELCESNS